MFEPLHPEMERALRVALDEDIGSGDVTTRSCIPESTKAQGKFYAREELTIAGIELLKTIYEIRGGVEMLELHHKSGDTVPYGECIASVKGKAWTLLECERTILNFLQRLSGVASMARKYSDAVKHTKCRILDTRKTTPGLRRLEKMAVLAGGAVNHRIGLFDAILIKNNHISAAGGVRAALERAHKSGLPVEIEVRTKEQLQEALDCGAKSLLLDNLTSAEASDWVRFVNGRATTELSGGITIDSIREYAETGADFISVGALTHSARAMNLNFRVELIDGV